MLNFFKNQFYLFQLEEYEIFRFLSLYKHLLIPKNKPRKTLDVTSKVKLLILVDLVLILCILLTLFITLSTPLPLYSAIVYSILGTALVLLLLHPLLICGAQVLILPIEIYLKNKLLSQAKTKLKDFPNLKILSIAGSYGKTTTKELATAILRQNYSTAETPENINTPLGISRLLIDKVTPENKWLVAELGEYKPGDIRNLCDLVTPNIGVITGINEAHLERMGNIDNAISTIFELAESTSDTLLLNTDDNRVRLNYEKFKRPKNVHFYGYKNPKLTGLQLKETSFSEELLQQNFILKAESNNQEFAFSTYLLGDYAFGLATFAIKLAKVLNISVENAQQAFKALKPIKHRLEPLKSPRGAIIIDDSYNGNPDGVKQALQVLLKFPNRRKLLLTPGLVETGNQNRTIHLGLGKEIAKVVDVVILIKNSAFQHIYEGLLTEGFQKNNVLTFGSTQEAHGALSSIVQSNDVILFQNDWADNYF